jgi:hybrid polyketide synthase / nonribosomal peptide synthetase ACE1
MGPNYGEIHIPLLEQAIIAMGKQNEILRTCIIENDGKLTQGIMDTTDLRLETNHIEEVEEVHNWVKLLQDHHIYDITQGRTMRVMLLSKSPQEHFFIAGLHPLIADGASFQSLLKQIQQLYATPG